MKKLAAILLCASMLMSGIVPIAAYAETSTTASVADSGDTETEEETPAPTSDPDSADATAAPAATDAPSEDYSGVDNPEDKQDELEAAKGRTSFDAGASGGQGFFGSKFPDCRGHWAEQIIVECTDRKYLDGYEDGTFRPDNPVTASEFAKIFCGWRGSFYQLTNGYWATPYIRKMLDDAIFFGGDYENYDVPMTREQVAKAVISALKSEYFPSSLAKYEPLIPDLNEADEEYRDYLIKSYITGIITGYEDGSIGPKNNVTRAELLNILKRTMNTDARQIPQAVTEAAGGAAQTFTYYTAAVQVRRSNNNNSMNYRLHTANSQYMTEDDPVSGLRLVEEVQGAQGFAMLMRYDLSDILKRESELKTISFILNKESWGSPEMGLFWYEAPISKTDWNRPEYVQVINGAAVAAADKTGYNTVVDNISAQLPTWGKPDDAVPDDKKTKPFASAELDGGSYTFELSLDELKAHMDSGNMVEFFMTSVNYDAYGLTEENKLRCYAAGTNGPQLFCTYDTGEEAARTVRLFADTAELEGGMLNLYGSGESAYLENFRNEQRITYGFNADLAGRYKMTIYYSANVNSGGGTVTFDLNGKKFDHEFAQTGSWAAYVYEDLGEVELKAGKNTLALTDKEIPNTYLINIKTITFEKID